MGGEFRKSHTTETERTWCDAEKAFVADRMSGDVPRRCGAFAQEGHGKVESVSTERIH